MRKVRLDLDALQVESFGTSAQAEEGGTVVANGYCTGARSTCQYPTAVYHDCPAGWTDDEPECWEKIPISQICNTDQYCSDPYYCSPV